MMLTPNFPIETRRSNWTPLNKLTRAVEYLLSSERPRGGPFHRRIDAPVKFPAFVYHTLGACVSSSPFHNSKVFSTSMPERSPLEMPFPETALVTEASSKRRRREGRPVSSGIRTSRGPAAGERPSAPSPASMRINYSTVILK